MTPIHELARATSLAGAIPATTTRPARAKSTKPDDENSTAQALKILVAEDDNISRLFISKVLDKFGHHVKAVKNGREVLQTLHGEDTFDVLLTDIQMPEIDGVELTKILRSDKKYQNNAHLPIIAMTAYAMTGDREKFLRAGIDEYLPKPIDGKLLSIMLEHIAIRHS